ncbi:MAG: DUF2459 domain-containing protein [Elainellaceae cyanobacterium]
MKSSRRVATSIFVTLALATAAVVLIRTPTVIIPPAAPVVPTTVYITDYGFHSRLLLPDGEGGLVQYAYGDWRYFALNQHGVVDGVAALFAPTPGTLARQEFSDLSDLRQVLGSDWQDTLLSISVANADVMELVADLDARFHQNINSRVEGSNSELVFVRDSQTYTIFHNSNHELAAWLDQLNCQVKGFVTWPNFRVKE